jgi:hypothetical protein
MALNTYRGGNGSHNDTWKTEITDMVNAFGVDHTYLSEFGLSITSLDDYSTDEAVQAAGISEMIEYIKASGMKRAIFFIWYDPTVEWGVKKSDGTYRQLWYVLTGKLG